jgi:hypothetical protein
MKVTQRGFFGVTWLILVVVPLVTGAGATPSATDGPHRPTLVSLSALKPDLDVFMQVGATQAEVAHVEHVVAHLSDVRRYALVGRAQALKIFRQIFRGRPDLLRRVTAAELPETIDVETIHRDCASANAVKTELGLPAGVDAVGYPRGFSCSNSPLNGGVR